MRRIPGQPNSSRKYNSIEGVDHRVGAGGGGPPPQQVIRNGFISSQPETETESAAVPNNHFMQKRAKSNNVIRGLGRGGVNNPQQFTYGQDEYLPPLNNSMISRNQVMGRMRT